jgi:23S rRNA-/tRNA-specific pseudouridylate synthase
MSFQSFPASRTLHFVAKKPGTVSEVLAAHMGFSVSHIQHLFEMGAIYLDKKRVFADTEFGSQAYLRIHKEPKRFPVDSINWEATVLAETKDFLVVNKPAGIPVHATLDNQVENILHQLRQKKKHASLCHSKNRYSRFWFSYSRKNSRVSTAL